MLLKIKTPFTFAHKGYEVIRYEKGTINAEDEQLINTALSEGWAEKVTKKKANRKRR